MILNITAEYAGRYFCERVPTTCISNKSDITIFRKLATIIISCVLCDLACMERPSNVCVISPSMSSSSTVTVETPALFIILWPPWVNDYINILMLFYFSFVEKASITITPEWNRRHTGEGLNLTAVVNGNPFPTTITVQKQDQTGGYVDHPSTKYSVIGLNTISFPRLSLDDNGQYRACVENSHDSIECSTFTILMTGR